MIKKSRPKDETVLIIKASEMFQPDWYQTQYPEVKSLGLDPAEHYAELGYLLNRDPSPLFSSAGYLQDHPDVADAKINPLFHFAKWGKAEGRRVRPSILAEETKQQAPSLKTNQAGASINAKKRLGMDEIGAQSPSKSIPSRNIGSANGEHGNALDAVKYRGIVDHIHFSVDELEKRLWGGYSLQAIPRLEKIKGDPEALMSDRVDAAWYLARWYVFIQDLHRAYDNSIFLRHCRDSIEHWKRRYTSNYTVQQVTSLSGMVTENAVLASFVLEIQCLTKLGRFPEAKRTLREGIAKIGPTPDFHLLLANLERLSAIELGTPEREIDAAQLNALNLVFSDVGLAPLRLKDVSKRLHFSNLAADALPIVTDQTEQVSIIIPAFNSEGTIHIPLISLINQTWRNLEIIVIDDCSTDTTVDVVRSFERLDPRIRLIAKPTNEGAYPARNLGLQEAKGDLIMVHDSDDWSHPQKIERQISHLRSKKDCVAVMSHWVRFDEWLVALGRWRPVGSLFDLNFSSLLFKRIVLERLKGWDNVRVSGDAEFRFRIQEVFGSNSIRNVPRRFLLSLSLSREDSLTQSKSTHLRSLEFGLRWQYRDGYQYWYRSANQKNSLGMSGSVRKFPVPLGNKSNRELKPQFDIVVVADYAQNTESLHYAISYMRAGKHNGMRVAAVHWRQFEHDPHSPLQASFYRCCMETDAEILTPGDEVVTRVLLFTQPRILQHKQDSFPRISSNYTVVLKNSIGAGSRKTDLDYDRLVVQSNIYSITHQRPYWTPPFESTNINPSEHGSRPTPIAPTWLPLVDAVTSADYLRNRTPHLPPVLGRTGEDIREAWPASKLSFETIYGSGRWEVLLLGPVYSLLPIIGKLPDYCKVITDDETTCAEFHSKIDFLIHFPSSPASAPGLQYVAQAMANGVVVILPRSYYSVFGDSVIYSEIDEVARLIEDIWHSPTRYKDASENALKYARKELSFDRLAARLDALSSPSDQA